MPFKPRKGCWRISTASLVAMAAIMVAAAAVANAWARSREWRGFAAGPDGLAREELPQRAARAKAMAQRAEAFLREAKHAASLPRDPALWPADSPWLGDELTPLVTTLGSLEAKRNAANPDWARVLTLKLHEAGVRPGSVVAAGCSGSFPALNLALACACEALDAELVAVSSVTASTWGANQPGFTWPEIEAQLVRAGIIRRASVAISTGGQHDNALDLDDTARATAHRIRHATATELSAVELSPVSLRDSINERLALYQRHAGDRRIALYVNVGGTEASLGESAASWRLRSGFLPARPFDLSPDRGVIARLAEEGVPTLSLLNIEALAFRWGVISQP